MDLGDYPHFEVDVVLPVAELKGLLGLLHHRYQLWRPSRGVAFGPGGFRGQLLFGSGPGMTPAWEVAVRMGCVSKGRSNNERRGMGLGCCSEATCF